MTAVTSLQEAPVCHRCHEPGFSRRGCRPDAASVADLYLLETTTPQVYFAASDGRYRGMVSIDEALGGKSQWNHAYTVGYKLVICRGGTSWIKLHYVEP